MIMTVFIGTFIYIIYEIFAILYMLRDIKTYGGTGQVLWIILFIYFPVESLLLYFYYSARKSKYI